MTALLCALEPEQEALVRALDGKREDSWAGGSFFAGTIDARPVVVCRIGVGKAMAAMVTQHVVDTYNPDSIVLTGIAGGLDSSLRIGDAIVARDCIQYDIDVTSLGFKRGQIPDSPYRILPADAALVSAASRCTPEADPPFADFTPSVRVGRVVSGDTFISPTNAHRYDFLTAELEGVAVDMESAAVALVATVNRTRWVAIRTISDRPITAPGEGRNRRVNMRSFLPWASRNSLQFVRHILAEG